MEKLFSAICLCISLFLVADALNNIPNPRLHYFTATGSSLQLQSRNKFIQNIQSLLASPSNLLLRKTENLKQRQARELTMPAVRNNQRARIPMVMSTQSQRHIPPGLLMNSKMAARGASPGLLRDQQYRPAFSLQGVSILNPALHDIDKTAIENRPVYQQHHPRQSTMLRGPLCLPGKVMTLRPQSSFDQVPTASETQIIPNVPRIPIQAHFATRQRYMDPQILNLKTHNSFNVPKPSASHPVKQFGVSQQRPSIMDLIDLASSNKFQPAALNRPGQKNRVVEVYHHIPAMASKNSGMRDRSPAVVYISKPQLQGLSEVKSMRPEIYLNPLPHLPQSAPKVPDEGSFGPFIQPFAIPGNKRPEILMNNFKPLLPKSSQYSKESQVFASQFAVPAKMPTSYASKVAPVPVQNSNFYKSNGYQNIPQFNPNRPLGNKAEDTEAQRYSLGDNNSHSKNPESEVDSTDSYDSDPSPKQESFNQDHLESSDSNFHSKISMEDTNDDIPFATTTVSPPNESITPTKASTQHYTENFPREEKTYNKDLQQIREFLVQTLPKQEVKPIPPRTVENVFNEERRKNYHEPALSLSLSEEFSKKSELTFNSLRKTTKMPDSINQTSQISKHSNNSPNSNTQNFKENFSHQPVPYTSSSPPPFRRYSSVTSNIDLTTTLSPQEAATKKSQRATTVIDFDFYTTEIPKVTQAKTTPNESNLSSRRPNFYQNHRYRQNIGYSTSTSIQKSYQTTRTPQWNHGVKYTPSPTRSSHAFTQKARDYTFAPTQRPTVATTLDEASSLYTTNVPLLNITLSNYGNVERQLQNLDKTIYKNQKGDILESSASATSTPKIVKQYFRGPQHYIAFEDTTPFLTTDVDLTTTTPSYSSTISKNNINSIIFTSTSPPRFVTTEDSVNPFNQQNVKVYSVNSHAKVINALHLANKVFGRRNHTGKLGINTSTSTTKPDVQHRFTYAPITKSSSTDTTDSDKTTTTRKLVFNFRTGTTNSIPFQSSSALPTFNNKDLSHKFISEGFPISTTDSELKSKTNNLDTSRNIPSEATLPSKPVSINNSSNDNNMGLYKSLRPVTKPYNSPTVSPNRKPFNETIKFLRKGVSNVFDFRVISPASSNETLDVETSSSDSILMTTYRPNREPSYGGSFSGNYSRGYDVKSVNSKEVNSENVTPLNSKESTTDSTLDNYVNHTENSRINIGATRNATPKTTTSASDDESKFELTTELMSQEQAIVESLKSMKVKMQEMMSKGFRHLMPMFMGLSSDVSISSDCTFSLLRWLRGIKGMEQWAVRMMDASSKIPEGILYGTFSTFGSYDECIGIKTPNSNTQTPYRGQYCSINIQPDLPENERHFTIQNAFRKYPKLKQIFQEMNIEEDTMAYYYILKHRVGVCMPSTCSIEDLGNVTEKLADQLKMKITVGRCETSEKPRLTKGQIISMCGVFIMFGIVAIATVFDICIRFKTKHEMDLEDIVRKKNILRQFSYIFSAYGNSCKILNTSLPVTHLSSLHGIKFLSITWVMLGHVYYCKDYLTLAGLNKVRDLGANLAFQVVLNSGFAADTFFFLSGLLVVYTAFNYLELNNGHFSIVGFYVRRYCRLTPAFLMISGVILLGPLAGSGPIWHETLEPFVSGCQNYWWTNLFYFSNFIPTSKTCVPHGWFLSCDMQFYIISPVIILALYRKPKIGMLLIVLGILSSMATTGCLTFMYNLPPVSLFSLPDPKDINEYLNTIGYKPYAHYAAYCVGMATGFLLAAKEKISVSKCIQIFGWISSTVTCILVIYGTWNWNSRELPDWRVSVAYATSSRTVWSLGVAWLVIVCYSGHGGIVNDILSWHGFVPLSRLSYLAYLIHPLLMYLYASYVRSPFYFSQYVVVYLYLSHLCVTFGLAFLFSLAFELPFLNLEKVFSRYLDQSKRRRRASFSHHHNNWLHPPEHPELKDSVVLMRRRPDRFVT